MVTQSDQPKPGDVRLVDGVEYIYASNRRFQLTPYEPEYQWVRKDDYSPGIYESVTGKLTGSTAAKKERAEMEQRMAKLEESLEAEERPPSPPVATSSRRHCSPHISRSVPPRSPSRTPRPG